MVVTAEQIRKELGVAQRRSGLPNGRSVDAFPPLELSTVAEGRAARTAPAVSSRRHVHNPSEVGGLCRECWGYVDDWRHLATDAYGRVTANVGG